MNIRSLMIVAFSLIAALPASAQLITYNSQFPEQNAEVRTNFFNAVGIAAPQFRVDFETGFATGQNVSDQTGLFPGGLVIRDTSPPKQAIIVSGPGSVDLSNPVGQFALTHDSVGFLDLDFSANPVDYIAFQDIDTVSNNSRLVLTFVGGDTFLYGLTDATLTTGNSAEFLGFYRNDLPRITNVRFELGGTIYGIDNLEYGIVPAPSSLTVLMLGGGLGLLSRWRRRKGL
jgi:hypothetical protein